MIYLGLSVSLLSVDGIKLFDLETICTRCRNPWTFSVTLDLPLNARIRAHLKLNAPSTILICLVPNSERSSIIQVWDVKVAIALVADVF